MSENISEIVQAEHLSALMEKYELYVDPRGMFIARSVGAIGISGSWPFYNAWDQDIEYQWGGFGGSKYAQKLINRDEAHQNLVPMVEDDWLSVRGIINAIRLSNGIETTGS